MLAGLRAASAARRLVLRGAAYIGAHAPSRARALDAPGGAAAARAHSAARAPARWALADGLSDALRGARHRAGRAAPTPPPPSTFMVRD